MANLSPLHQPVLLKEVMDVFDWSEVKVIVDGTLGLGGYSEAALNSAKNVKVVAFELDEDNLSFAKDRLADFGDRINFVNDNFANLKVGLASHGLEKVDGIMLDLGLSSPQIDQAEKGFSFMREGDLDMRFGKKQKLTAKEVVNEYSVEHLTKIFRDYGEEKSAWKIANAIVERRKTAPFLKTTDLADFIKKLLSSKKQKTHPATKVFQALRIEVNQELASLSEVLNQSLEVLEEKGRIAVVSYHSLEDRIVKNFFRDNSREFVNLPNELTTRMLNPPLKLVFKKPVQPSSKEIAENPRARSAKLRVAEKI